MNHHKRPVQNLGKHNYVLQLKLYIQMFGEIIVIEINSI